MSTETSTQTIDDGFDGFRDGSPAMQRFEDKAMDNLLDYGRAKQITKEDGALAALKDGVARATSRWGSPIEHAKMGAYKQAAQAGGGLVNVVLTVTLAAVIAYIGIFVMQETDSAASFTDNSSFDNASDSVTSGVESGFSLFQVVIIALMLGIIVTALVGLRPS